MADYYAILGVSKSATQEDIKKAYRNLAKKFHPDKVKPQEQESAKKKFQEIQQAYDVLYNPEKRSSYDQIGHENYEKGGGFNAGQNGGFHDFSDIFQDIFGQFGEGFSGFGSSSRGSRAKRGQDLKYSIEISLEEAYTGIDLKVEIPKNVSCKGCAGSGINKSGSQVRCNTCYGKGKVIVQSIFMNMEQICPDCQGKGVKYSTCSDCKGKCVVYEKKKIDIKIPKGVYNGINLKIMEEGNAGTHQGPAGDLYVNVNIKKHELFEVEGTNIVCKIPISFLDAVLGSTIEAPLIDGSASQVKIPAGISYGSRIKLAGKGMPVLKSTARGDMYILVEIETPQSLSSKEKELYQQLKTLQIDNMNSKGFLNKMKGFLNKFKKQ